jgi:hypothetical protein
MQTTDIQLLNYTFRFKRLTWREEFKIKYDKKQNPYKVWLAHALVAVSGISVGSVEDALKVLEPLPSSVVRRMYAQYKIGFPNARRFETAVLYRAPEPSEYSARVAKDEQQLEQGVTDPAVQSLVNKYGERELREAQDISKKILEASRLRGAVKATPDGK